MCIKVFNMPKTKIMYVFVYFLKIANPRNDGNFEMTSVIQGIPNILLCAILFVKIFETNLNIGPY